MALLRGIHTEEEEMRTIRYIDSRTNEEICPPIMADNITVPVRGMTLAVGSHHDLEGREWLVEHVLLHQIDWETPTDPGANEIAYVWVSKYRPVGAGRSFKSANVIAFDNRRELETTLA